MIQKYTISNFYSIREPLEVSFEASKEKHYNEDWIVKKGNFKLLKCLLLYGANGSGKSNILKSFNFLRSVITKERREEDNLYGFNKFLLDQESTGKPTIFDLYFFIGDVRYHYYIEIGLDEIIKEELKIYKSGKNPTLIYSRKYNDQKSKNIVRFGTWLTLSNKDRKALEDLTTNRNSVLALYGNRNFHCIDLQIVYDYFKNNFYRVYDVEHSDNCVAKTLKDDISLQQLVVEMLRSFRSNIVGLDIQEKVEPLPEGMLQYINNMGFPEETKGEIMKLNGLPMLENSYVHQTKLGTFQLRDIYQSEGTRKFIRFVVLFSKAIREGWLLAIDEYGAGLQPKTQHLLLEYFLRFSEDSQLILATQSIGLLDFKMLRRDAIHIVSKDELGMTHIDSRTVRGIHRNIKLRNAYNDGKFLTMDPNEPDIDLFDVADKFKKLIYKNRKEDSL